MSEEKTIDAAEGKTSGRRPRSLGTVDNLYSWIRSAILSGKLAAGEVLNQAQLAQQLHVSRTPLREALRMLQAEGLVVGKLNQKMLVSEISPDDIDGLTAARILLESSGLALTIPQMTNEDIERVRHQLRHMNAQLWLNDRAAWEVHHNTFHRMLVMHVDKVAGRVMAETISSFQVRAERFRRYYVSHDSRASTTALDEHTRIVEAVEARDVQGAVRLLAGHYARTAFAVLESVAPDYQPVALRNALAVATGTSLTDVLVALGRAAP